MTVSPPDAFSPAAARRVAALLAVLPVAAVGLVGCSSDDAPAADGPCAASSSIGRDGPSAIPVPESQVTVLDEGADPQPLTPAPDTGSPQRVTLTTDSIEASIVPGDEGQEVRKTEQALTTPITARVVCDDPSNLEFTIGEPTTPDTELTPQLDAIAGSDGGITFGAGVSPRSLRLFPDDAAGSPARSAVEQSFTGALDHSVVLPTAPVGVGGRWQSVRTVTAAATVRRTTTVTLTERVGNVLTLAVEVDETPADSVFRIPGSADTLSISRYSMSGSGTITVDLTRLLPTGGKITMTGARELQGDANAAPLLQRNEYTVSWARS